MVVKKSCQKVQNFSFGQRSCKYLFAITLHLKCFRVFKLMPKCFFEDRLIMIRCEKEFMRNVFFLCHFLKLFCLSPNRFHIQSFFFSPSASLFLSLCLSYLLCCSLCFLFFTLSLLFFFSFSFSLSLYLSLVLYRVAMANRR